MILVLNCGSQSIKWKVFDENLKLKKEGYISFKRSEEEIINRIRFKGILKNELKKVRFDIDLAGHRVVHGGLKFRKTSAISEEDLKELERINRLAPLHNPYNIMGIRVAMKMFPNAVHKAVFDTEYYKDLPEKARYYPIPEKFVKSLGLRRFGFHGISHEYAIQETISRIKKQDSKIISCHLGGGCSITAARNGRPVDTSMGFTPMEGLMMMTRAGDIDPGIVLELSRKYLDSSVRKMLNNESGMKDVSGTSDMLEILRRKDKKAKLALEMFVYRIQKYIGSYYAVLGGIDAIVFTGAIGSGIPKTRKMILRGLDFLNGAKKIVVKSNEELMIAKKILIP